MNPRILIGVLAAGYALWKFYDAWSADALNLVPAWRLGLWAAMFVLGAVVILRSLKPTRA